MNGENQENNLEDKTSVPEPFSGINQKTKKKIVIGLFVGLMLLIGGMTVVLAVRIWEPLWNPFRPASEKVLIQALENMLALEAYQYSMDFGLKIVGTEEDFETEIIVEGKENLRNLTSQALFDINALMGGMKVFLDGEMRFIDNILYLKAGTFPEIPIIMDPKRFKDKWFHVDFAELGIDVVLPTGEQAKIMENLKPLLLQYPIVKVVEEFPDQKIDGKTTYNYLLTVDKENLKRIWAEYAAEYLKVVGNTNLMPASTEEEEKEMLKGMDDFLKRIGEINFKIWIGKKDYMVYRVKGEKTINLKDLTGLALGGLEGEFGDLKELKEETQGKIYLTFSSSYSAFNEPVEIIVPEESKDIIRILTSLFGAMMVGVEFGGMDPMLIDQMFPDVIFPR